MSVKAVSIDAGGGGRGLSTLRKKKKKKRKKVDVRQGKNVMPYQGLDCETLD